MPNYIIQGLNLKDLPLRGTGRRASLSSQRRTVDLDVRDSPIPKSNMFADHAGGEFVVVASVCLEIKAHAFEIGFVFDTSRRGREAVDPLLTVELGAFFEQKSPGAKITVAGNDKVQKDAGFLSFRFDDDQPDRHHVTQDENDHLLIVRLELIGGNEVRDLLAIEFKEAFEVGAVGADLHQGEVIPLLPHAPKVIGVDAEGQAVEQDDRECADEDAVKNKERCADHVDDAQSLQRFHAQGQRDKQRPCIADQFIKGG